MNEQQTFIMADQALNNVVAQIKDDQWAMAIPDWFQVGRAVAENLTLRTIINYHAYDDAWVPAVLSGATLDAATDVPRDMTADLLGGDPKAAFAAYVDKAVAAADNVENGEKIVHLSYGDFTTNEYLTHISSFRGFRAYDIAKLIGVDTTLPHQLVEGLWDLLSPHFDEWRAAGIFKPALPIPEGANRQTELLLSVGRPV